MGQFLFVWSMNSNDFKRRSLLVSSMSMDQGDRRVSRSNSTDPVSKKSISHLCDSLINPTRAKPKPVGLLRRLFFSGIAVQYLFIRENKHDLMVISNLIQNTLTDMGCKQHPLRLSTFHTTFAERAHLHQHDHWSMLSCLREINNDEMSSRIMRGRDNSIRNS